MKADVCRETHFLERLAVEKQPSVFLVSPRDESGERVPRQARSPCPSTNSKKIANIWECSRDQEHMLTYKGGHWHVGQLLVV